MNEWLDKECTSIEFSVSVVIIFWQKIYFWVSHANLAILWWRSSKFSSTGFVLVLACHIMILSWTKATPEFFFATLVKKTYWWFIDYICNIYLILYNWKHCDVVDWNRFWFLPYFLKYQFNHRGNISFL